MTGIRELFSPAEGLCYLDTATYGLPPQPTVDALDTALKQWQSGTAHWIDDWDAVADSARSGFAELVDVPVADVAMIPSASVGVGTVAAGLGPDDVVVVPDDEFTSLLFPLLVAEDHGTTVRQVPFDGLGHAISADVTLVATSLVQMQTGRVADLTALSERAEQVGARVLLDATHGLPFVGMGGRLRSVDYVVGAAYKHLLCPRGVAFLVTRAEHHNELPPWNANWRAADDPYGRYFGGPLTLAPGAARFDVSVAWLPWVGAATSLELLCEWASAGSLEQPKELAEALAHELGVAYAGSSIVCVPVSDTKQAALALAAAGVKAGFRGDGVRLSTHVYTTADDIGLAAATLAPFVAGAGHSA